MSKDAHTHEAGARGEAESDLGAPIAVASGLRALPYEAKALSTERLLLRPLAAEDIETAKSYRKRKGVARYLLWEVHEREQGEEPYAGRRAQRLLEQDGDGLVFAVELPDPEGGHGRVIGDMSLFLKSAAEAQLEIGWVFHPAVHGRGFATEAVQALLTLCFETLGAHRVVAELDPRNEVSARLCDSLGLRREGHFVENAFTKGEWVDTCVHALLDREFAVRQVSTAAAV